MKRPSILDELTTAQVDAIEEFYTHVLIEWSAIKGLDVSIADVWKSCLLRRLCDGKSPLTLAPPCAYSAPWYELIEYGRGSPVEVFECDQGLVLNQSTWIIEKKVSNREWLVRYRTGARRQDLSPDLWRVHNVGEIRTGNMLDKGWRIERLP